MHNILVVEDESAIRRWIIELATEVFPTACFQQAATLEQARANTGEAPDLLLTDLSLPDGFGYELIAEHKLGNPVLPCVVITSFEDDDYLFPALQAGADGYLLKDQSDDDLIRLLTGILEGKPPISPAIAHRLFDYFRAQRNPPAGEPLTAREQETLQLISKGYSVKETARLLNLSHHTVAGYIKDIYRKLQISSRAEAALAASRMGLN